MKIEIRPHPFNPWEEVDRYQQGVEDEGNQLAPGSFGACAVFVGTMRDFNDGSDVSAMELEHYEGMTERQLTDLSNEVLTKHGLLDAMILHRVGKIHPNDPIVLVVAWSAHRAAAFDACREMMELLKSKATFWKKEVRPDGEKWVSQNTPG